MATPLASRAAAYEWQSIAPADAGFAPDLEARLDKLIADKRAWNLHGLVVLRNDRLVLERYFEGEDNARGIGPIGQVASSPTRMHDLRSCSKSIVGLLYGIALQQGKVPPPEAPLFSAFPEYADLAGKDGRDRLTIQHVLTMTMGTDWDESSLPYSDPRNSEIAMDNAPDRYRYILERRVVDTPGAHWTYCGGATALLARIIAKGTGKTLHEFARENLFDPLGMGADRMGDGARRRTFRRLGRAHVGARSGAHRHDDAARRQGRRPCCRSRRLGHALHHRLPSAPTRFAATAINGSCSTSPSASRKAGRSDGWSACGWLRARAASGCSSSRRSNSSLPSPPATTAPRTSGFRRPGSCARSCWRASFERPRSAQLHVAWTATKTRKDLPAFPILRATVIPARGASAGIQHARAAVAAGSPIASARGPRLRG